MNMCFCMCVYACERIYKDTNKSPIFYLSIRLSAYICFSFSFSLVSQFLFPPIFPFVYLCLSLRPFLLISLLSLPLNHSFSLTFFLFLPLSLPLSLSLFLTLSLSLSLSLSFLTLSFQGGNIAYQSGRYSYQTFRTRVSPYELYHIIKCDVMW